MVGSGLRAFVFFLLLSFPLSSTARAELFGLSSILDPEGSRLFPSTLVAPRHPGKPDPRWKSFKWKYIDLDTDGAKIRFFYYAEEEWSARFTIDELKKEITYLKGRFNGYVPSKRFNYLLFNSHREFKQTNVFNVTEGVQGITATEELTMAVPYWGEAETFSHISTHEMTHQFQVQKLNELSKVGAEKVEEILPLWFIEGMAEYYSLHGLDPETRGYLRDLVVYPDKSMDSTMPKFFEEKALNFVQVYKVGQAKLDFLDTEFGAGTTQKLLETAGRQLGDKFTKFEELVTTTLSVSKDEVEKRWQKYIDLVIKADADHLTQNLDSLKTVPNLPDTVDLFDVSPDGKWMMTRELDITTGETSLYLFDPSNPKKRELLARDNEPELVRLYFMEMPTLTLGNTKAAYVVETMAGPEIEVRSFKPNGKGGIDLGSPVRYEVHDHQLVEAHSPALSPDETALAFVGLDFDGRENIFRLDLDGKPVHGQARQITDDLYSWKNLSWGPSGIWVASDRTGNGRYALFRIDPKTNTLHHVSGSPADQFGPDARNGGSIAFYTLEGGSQQVHAISGNAETQLTDAKTSFSNPKIRGDTLYAVGFRSGRFHVYKLARDQWVNRHVRDLSDARSEIDRAPWDVPLANLEDYKITDYKAFVTSGVRVDNIMGFLSTGAVIGLSGSVSDLMRNYSISGDLISFGQIKDSEADLFLTRRDGRTKWTTGAYFVSQPRADTLFDHSATTNFYTNHEYGGAFAMEYPFGAYFFTDAELRLAGVYRTDYSNPLYAPQWDAINPGTEFLIDPVVRLGYDRILYEAFTGPIKGYGLMLEADTSYYPRRVSLTERGRLDLSYFLHLAGTSVLAFEGIMGASWDVHNGTFRNPFFVSSDDLFRAYYFDDNRLLGNYLLGFKSEFRFPIGTLFKFPPLRGLLAYDLGSVYNYPDQLGMRVNSSWSWGIDFNIPPISIGLIFSYPIRQAAGPQNGEVTHFALRYLYY